MQTQSPSAPIPPKAIHAPSTTPNARRHLSNDKVPSLALSRADKYSTAAAAFAAKPHIKLADFPASSPNRSRRYFRPLKESASRFSRHRSNEKRPVLYLAHMHGPTPPQIRSPNRLGPPQSARSAANPPTRCASKSCRHPSTYTFHSHKKCSSAYPLRPIPRKSRWDSKAPRQSPQSNQLAAHQKSGSMSAPHRSFSKRRHSPTRNNRHPAALARPSLPKCAPRGTAQSIAISSLRRISDRISPPHQAKPRPSRAPTEPRWQLAGVVEKAVASSRFCLPMERALVK